MEMRKGFMYTLEAIIASSIILTMAIYVMPNIGPQTTAPLSSVDSGLEKIEQRGEFNQELSPNYVEQEIAGFVPSSYNHTAVVYSSDNNISTVDLDHEVYLNGSGGGSDLQIWSQNGDITELSFAEQVILEDPEQDYIETDLDSNEGWLNITGTGTVSYSFNSYYREGDIPEGEQIISKNALSFYEGDREVQLHLWR